jgi:hypothetical protein
MTTYGVFGWNNVTLSDDGVFFLGKQGISWNPGSWIAERNYHLLEIINTRPKEQIWIEVGDFQKYHALPYLKTDDNPFRYFGEKESRGLPLLTFMLEDEPIATLDKACLIRDSEQYKLKIEQKHIDMIPPRIPIKGHPAQPPYAPFEFTGNSWPIQGLLTFFDNAPKIGILALLGGYLRDGTGIALTDSLDKKNMDDALYRARMVHLNLLFSAIHTCSYADYHHDYSESVKRLPDVKYVSLSIPLSGGPNLAQMMHKFDEAYCAEIRATYTFPEKSESKYDPKTYYYDIGLDYLNKFITVVA